MFETPDPPLDTFPDPTVPWVFVQETWSGTHGSEHCRELGYPERLKADVLREGNEALRTRHVVAKLPETSSSDVHFLVAYGPFQPRLVPSSEPLDKLIICTRLAAPATGRDRMLARLRAFAGAPDLPLGEPTTVWMRVYRDGTQEFGFGWFAPTEVLQGALAARGYVEDAREGVWRRGEDATGRLVTNQLWWTGRGPMSSCTPTR